MFSPSKFTVLLVLGIQWKKPGGDMCHILVSTEDNPVVGYQLHCLFINNIVVNNRNRC